MARAYSLDLRERVVASVAAGQICRAVAKPFIVRVASVVKWCGASAPIRSSHSRGPSSYWCAWSNATARRVLFRRRASSPGPPFASSGRLGHRSLLRRVRSGRRQAS